MSDIVERLRRLQKAWKNDPHGVGEAYGQAADEIERLRAELKDANKTISQNNSLIGKMAAAIKKLRAALELADAKLGGGFMRAGTAEVRVMIARALRRHG